MDDLDGDGDRQTLTDRAAWRQLRTVGASWNCAFSQRRIWRILLAGKSPGEEIVKGAVAISAAVGRRRRLERILRAGRVAICAMLLALTQLVGLARAEDPAAVAGTEEERLAAFRRIRDQLRDRVKTFVHDRD